MTPAAPPATSSRRRTTWLFALAAALHGLVFLLALPPWMGEDEPWQLEYASHVAAGYRPWGGEPVRRAQEGEPDPRTRMPSSQLQARRRFQAIPDERLAATQREIMASMAAHGFQQRADWAGMEAQRVDFDELILDFTATGQPPLYFLLVGGWLRLVGAESVEAQLQAGRALSWVLFVVTALLGLALARTVFDDDRLALCAAALVAFLPMSARQAAVVNNDVLAKLCAALVLLLSVRWVRGRARSWELGLATVVCALGLLSKSTAAGAVVALVLALLLRSDRIAARIRPRTAAVLVLAVAALTTLAWVFGNNPVVPRTVSGFVRRVKGGLDLDLLAKFARTFAGSFGWESRFLPGPVNALLGLALAGGLGLCAWRGGRVAPGRTLVWCALVAAAQLVLIVLRGVAVGRYLMPVLPVIAVLLSAGLVGSWPERTRSRAAAAFLLVLVIYEAFFLWGGLLAHETLLLGV